MRVRNALLAATFLALPLAAQAQQINGLYLGAGAGFNWAQGTDVSIDGAVGNGLSAFSVFNGGNYGAGRSGKIEFDFGWGAVASIGWGFGNGLRAELEGSYRANPIDTFTGFAGAARGPLRAGGDTSQWGVMANVLYDIDLGPGSFVIPYVGVGAGVQWIQYSNVRTTGANGVSINLDSEDTQFAYQAILGAAFPIAAAPGLAITAEGRFMGTLPATIDVSTGGLPAQFGGANPKGTADVDNYNWSLFVGLRYAFNTTPPPPPVVAPTQAAAPAPARTFLVFFDFDRADLTDRARQIIAEAATNAQRGGTTRVEVSGHADRAGTPQYNQRLSERRAAAVAAELERRGVPRSAMAIQAFGESRPLVPTADGVREPQNRRVEIVLR